MAVNYGKILKHKSQLCNETNGLNLRFSKRDTLITADQTLGSLLMKHSTCSPESNCTTVGEGPKNDRN